MGTNKVASVILFDVSQSMKTISDNGIPFFDRSLECLKKMVLRKMFSQDNDDLGIILFGTDETENNLARGLLYNHIAVFSPVVLPNWGLFRKIENLSLSNRFESDWIETLVVAIDFMKSETQGRRYRKKQIVVFSSFSGEISSDEETVRPLVDTLEGENLSLVVVGNEMRDAEEAQTQTTNSLHLILNTVCKLELGIHFSFSEIEKDLMYFDKKRKMPRLLKVNFCIGSNIQLPVRWMKVTNEETRFKWDLVTHTNEYKVENDEKNISYAAGDADLLPKSAEVQFVTDVVKCTNFGSTIVELSYADIEAMSRKSGGPSFLYIGSVKSSKISVSMFVSSDVYVVVPDKDARSVAMFSAFVDALLKAKKYAIARRVPVKNGKISIGALLPVSDELGKAMYFLKLPYAEWIQKVPEKPISEPCNEEAMKAIDDLIDAAMLPDDLLEEGKGLQVRDPTFQSRCHALSQRAMGKLPESTIIDLPEPVQKIINPFPLNEAAREALQRIAAIFPFTELEEKLSTSNKKKEEKNYKKYPISGDAIVAKIKNEISKEKARLEELKEDPNDPLSPEIF